MAQTTQDIALEHRLTKIETYLETHELHTRVLVLERWKFIILGAAILVGSLFTLFAEEIKGML